MSDAPATIIKLRQGPEEAHGEIDKMHKLQFMQSEMIEQQQKLITDLEAKRDAATPTPARLAQFDQKIRNAEWYQEQAEAKFAETIENLTYYQELKVEEETELQKTVEEVEKMK